MAPRTQSTPTPAPATTLPASIPMTTLGGFAISVLAFIPIDPKDLRKQAEIPMLLLDIQDGKKTVADLAPYLKDIEFRQQHVRKRFTVEEAAVLMAKPMTHTPEQTDIDADGNGDDDQPEDDGSTFTDVDHDVDA